MTADGEAGLRAETIEVLVRVRAVLRACLDDRPGDLAGEARKAVIANRVDEVSGLLDAILGGEGAPR